MKTEYQARNKAGHYRTEWTPDATHLRNNCRITPADTLWRRQSETEPEAAVRRMAALDKWWRDKDSPMRLHYESDTPATFADRLSPPPTATETQVDWETLEPVKDVPVWSWASFWVAGIDEPTWSNTGDGRINLEWICKGHAAIGHTRESALRNLAELQQSRQ